MTPSILLESVERRELLEIYRKHTDPEIRFRAHILLLLADGRTWEDIGTLLYCSSRTIDRWVVRVCLELVSLHELVAKPTVERLDVTVLPSAPRSHRHRLRADLRMLGRYGPTGHY
jgi:hypothetical protein